MPFLYRIVTTVGATLVFLVVTCAVLLLLVFLVNKLIQLVAWVLGYQVGDFVSWMFDGIKKRFSKKRKHRIPRDRFTE